MNISEVQGHTKPHINIAAQVFKLHNAYKESSLQHRRFKHRDIVPLLEQLSKHPEFQVQVAGKSVEHRDIYLVKVGTGKTKVMLWSQMHGDEPTATMALFDLLNFLQQPGHLDSVRNQVLQNVTLYIVPMLNPDGAELYKRQNAFDVDLNRDALRLQSPEARLLKSLCDSIKPEFGFNLHDQSRYYTVGATPKPATISFLAPAFDHAQTMDTVRARAMRTIVGMNEALQALIPGQVAKYSDEHEPRAFGDNIQKWGTSVILIESGGYHGDPEKQYIRQLNFASIVSALHLISEDGHTAYALEDYYKIPENGKYLYDVVVRNISYRVNEHEVLLDVGIMREETSSANYKGFYHSSYIDQLGDMSVFYGYEEVDGEGLKLVPGKTYEKPFKDLAALSSERVQELIAEGYTTVRLEVLPSSDIHPEELPLNIVSSDTDLDYSLSINNSANFTLQDSNGNVRYAVVNGFVYNLEAAKPALFHGLMH